MIDRNLNLFSIAFLGIVLTLLLVTIAGTPMGRETGRVRPDVPWTRSPTVLAESSHDIEIRLTADHRILVGPNIVPEGNLRQQLAAIAARGLDRQVLIHADRSLPFSRVQEVLAASRDAGFAEVSLVAKRRCALGAD